MRALNHRVLSTYIPIYTILLTLSTFFIQRNEKMYTLFMILIAEPQFPVGCRHELRHGGNRIPDFVFCLDDPAGNHIRIDFAVEEVDDFGNNAGQDLNVIRLRLSDELDALFDRGGIDDEYAEDRPESEGVGFPDQPAARRDDACRSETLVYELKGGRSEERRVGSECSRPGRRAQRSSETW